MNWEMLSAIAEILGSAAVFVTLIYLTIQSRQNTASTQANTRQAILDADQQFLIKLIESPEIYTNRFKEGLTDEDKIQMGAYLIMFVRMRENNWLQYRNGVLDEVTWESYRSSIAQVLSDSTSRSWWQHYAVDRQAFDSEFVSIVNELLADTPVQEGSALAQAFD